MSAQALQSYYGGMERTWITLFRAITGADWSIFAAPMAGIGKVWGYVWIGYIFCALFGLLNLVTGAARPIGSRRVGAEPPTG